MVEVYENYDITHIINTATQEIGTAEKSGNPIGKTYTTSKEWLLIENLKNQH